MEPQGWVEAEIAGGNNWSENLSFTAGTSKEGEWTRKATWPSVLWLQWHCSQQSKKITKGSAQNTERGKMWKVRRETKAHAGRISTFSSRCIYPGSLYGACQGSTLPWSSTCFQLMERTSETRVGIPALSAWVPQLPCGWKPGTYLLEAFSSDGRQLRKKKWRHGCPEYRNSDPPSFSMPAREEGKSQQRLLVWASAWPTT